MSLFPIFPPTIIPATVSFASSSVDAGTATVYTFSGVSIGTAASSRKVVVGTYAGSQTKTVSTLTIAGISASQVVQLISGTETVEIWQADVPTGTTGDVVVTWSGAQDACGIGVWAVYNAASAADDTGTSTATPPTDNLNIPALGIALGYHKDGDTSTYTWTNLTEDFDEVLDTTVTHTGASQAFTTQQTALTITSTRSGSSGTPLFAIASWGPG